MSDKLYAKLREFHAMTQHPNWDLRHAMPIVSQLWSDLWETCVTAHDLGFDDPWVTPQSNGSVELAWNLPRGRVISVLFFYDSISYPWTIYNKDRETIDSGSAQYICGLFDKLFELFPVKQKEYLEKNKENEQ